MHLVIPDPSNRLGNAFFPVSRRYQLQLQTESTVTSRALQCFWELDGRSAGNAGTINDRYILSTRSIFLVLGLIIGWRDWSTSWLQSVSNANDRSYTNVQKGRRSCLSRWYETKAGRNFRYVFCDFNGGNLMATVRQLNYHGTIEYIRDYLLRPQDRVNGAPFDGE